MKAITASINSMKLFFGEDKLGHLSARWLDRYTPSLSDSQLCALFESVSGESASYFGITGNAKAIAEKLMIEFYHNEAFVKASVVNSLKKEKNVTFFEMPLLNSRIDICSINGHSCAYEIKTEYDSFKRLGKQIDDYLKVFEFVYVVCPFDKVDELQKIIPNCVGVIGYDNSQTVCKLITIKEASLSNTIDPFIQLSLLHKKEKKCCFCLENDSCKTNDYFKQCLKKRYKKKWCSFKKASSTISRLDYQYFFNYC